MNPYEAILMSIDASGPVPAALVCVRGALTRVRLDLTPEARVGDLVVVDAGVTIAVLSNTEPGPPARS